MLDMPLSDVDKIAKMLPGTSLDKVFGADMAELKSKLMPDESVKTENF